MNTKSKEILEKRLENYKSFYTQEEIELFSIILSDFIEHPTKPGYKRQDIEYFIKIINQ